jgi:hypothetical protein
MAANESPLTGQKHAGGRPTSLTDDLMASAREYVDESDNTGVQTLLPTIERLALTLGVSRDSLYEWEGLSQEFSDILNKLRAIQADKLIQNGLLNRYNPAMAKMMLSKHGYVEQKDFTSDGKQLPTPILGAIGVQPDNSDTQNLIP